jgi:hypothetical protein
MPPVWMFLLKSLTPARREVFLVDGNAERLSEKELVQYLREKPAGYKVLSAGPPRPAEVFPGARIPVAFGM